MRIDTSALGSVFDTTVNGRPTPVHDVAEHCDGADQHDITTLDEARTRILCNGCGTTYLKPFVIRFQPAEAIGAEAVYPQVPTPQELLDAAYELVSERRP